MQPDLTEVLPAVTVQQDLSSRRMTASELVGMTTSELVARIRDDRIFERAYNAIAGMRAYEFKKSARTSVMSCLMTDATNVSTFFIFNND